MRAEVVGATSSEDFVVHSALSSVFYSLLCLLWPPCLADADIIFLSCCFLLFFFWPNLSGRRLHVYHTSIHGVALVRI